jgi:PAS domain S-box-containing protein
MSTRWGHPVVRQWALLVALVLLVSAAASLTSLFWRVDQALYDAVLPGGPAPGDIVIVAVDDASIAALGRWPWRRALHAALLDRLRDMGARAVALDFLFTEPDPASPLGDAALAMAMRRGPPTVLPLLVQMPTVGSVLQVREPITELAAAAAGIGHVNLEMDRDGMVRSVYLREGLGAPDRLHLAAELLELAPGPLPPLLRGERHPDPGHAAPVWVRDYHLLIPFLGPPGHITQVSYADVLRGSVPEAALAGKLIFVGATAAGIGDAYPTPRSGEGRGMSGVEITANIADALRSERLIRPMGGWPAALLGCLPLVAAALGLLLLPPTGALFATLAAGAGTLILSIFTLRIGGWWWPPCASLAGLTLLYPLWSWRRLVASQAFLEAEFARLAQERFPLLTLPRVRGSGLRPVEHLEQRITLLRQATERLRGARSLFADTLNSLPDATLLIDGLGRIVLANPAAASLFGVADYRALEDTAFDARFALLTGVPAVRFQQIAADAPCTSEADCCDGERHLLVRAVPFNVGAGVRLGTIITMADITELRAAQREREDVLRFLSHDMKSPASSLLGLAQLQRDPAHALPPAELSGRLDLLAQRLLALVDGFVSLSRAEAVDPRAFDDFDLRDAIQDAYDEVWATAQVRVITITTHFPEEIVMVHGDRQLVARAIVNLLGNAVKFSPHGGRVTLALVRQGREGVIRVADQGPGIAPENAAALFQRFSRGLHRGSADPGGAGLGLAFVRVVTAKHRGRAWAEAPGSDGAVFCLSLPVQDSPASA